jgi:hypothetical protein
MQTLYQGRYHFTFIAGHPSWCNLRVLQREKTTLVIFTKAVDNPGTFLFSAASMLATQVVTTYHLDPGKTVFLEYTPPETEQPTFLLPDDDPCKPLERLSLLFSGASEEKLERMSFHWLVSHDTGTQQYRADDAQWEPLTPKAAVEIFRLVE